MKSKSIPFRLTHMFDVKEFTYLPTPELKVILINDVEYVVPVWANYLAVDANKGVWIYAEKPYYNLGFWKVKQRNSPSERIGMCNYTGSTRLSLSKIKEVHSYVIALYVCTGLLVAITGTIIGLVLRTLWNKL